jgi:hypothetical protein
LTREAEERENRCGGSNGGGGGSDLRRMSLARYCKRERRVGG